MAAWAGDMALEGIFRFGCLPHGNSVMFHSFVTTVYC